MWWEREGRGREKRGGRGELRRGGGQGNVAVSGGGAVWCARCHLKWTVVLDQWRH